MYRMHIIYCATRKAAAGRYPLTTIMSQFLAIVKDTDVIKALREEPDQHFGLTRSLGTYGYRTEHRASSATMLPFGAGYT